MQVGVIGTGHVGLVTAAVLAELGHDVVGYDADPGRRARLQLGQPWFHEPGLAELVGRGMAEGRLAFRGSIEQAVARADVVFVCVGTPGRADGRPDLLAVEAAARAVARHALPGTVVVEKSTVLAGTARRVQRVIELERGALDAIDVVSNPEFLREGRAVADALRPDRILVGAESHRGFAVMRGLYAEQVAAGVPLIETDLATAELSKHACNAFLALKISYANALAELCERAGADVVDVTRVMGADPRIGPEFLGAGIGYGGSCFPKDLAAFQRLSASLGYDFGLLAEVDRINRDAVDRVVRKVVDVLWNVPGKRVALLGLAFKPDTDDIRFSPALAVAARLVEEGAEVVGYDPLVGDAARDAVPGLEVVADPHAALRGAHCAVVCTACPEVAALDLVRVRDEMRHAIVVDGRNVLDPTAAARAGVVLFPTGRPRTQELVGA